MAVTRRELLIGSASVIAGGAIGSRMVGGSLEPAAALPGAAFRADDPRVRAALRVLGKRRLRHPDSRPFPHLSAGADTMPEIEHIVVLMMENHSYDNFLGMLGRGPGQTPRGDGFTIAANGEPTATNPRPDGRTQHAFRMPTTCQLHQRPSNEWMSSHEQFNHGKMDGFVRAPIAPAIPAPNGPVAMGYWTEHDLPFMYDLATHFPICDRFFCSLLGATHANRRYLIAGTSCGMVGDVEVNPSELGSDVALVVPANGTIFDRLTAHDISWTDYCAQWPLGASAELYPLNDVLTAVQKKSVDAFFADAKAGTLPAFSLIDPNFSTQSQENPQDIVVGERLMQRVVEAVGKSPAWHKTILFITYDEHGGYYDHVPPPVALAPDLIPPLVKLKEPAYDGFRRYGFRVPAIVVSPYAKKKHVSSKVHDFGSILAFVERKWNLGALTYRDANANDLTDCLDLRAMRRREPTFPRLPKLRDANYRKASLACTKTGPGQIPPKSSISGRKR
ncbi:MAG TPA: alkaline phosphatase family protein [Mycobacteriales bacterium]|nr:alkaline phosphatase family protein [Mycobacteriales bacterium]